MRREGAPEGDFQIVPENATGLVHDFARRLA
jgi:hypothetical protein